MIISGWISYKQLKTTTVEKSQEQMETLLEQYALYADSLIHDSESNIKLFSNNEMLRRYMVTPSEEERYEILQPLLMKQFQSYQKAYPEYYEFRLIFPDGFEDLRLVNRSIENKNMDEANTPFIKNILEQKNGTYSRIMRNPDNNKLALYIASALTLKDNAIESNSSIPRFRGYLVLTIDISEMVNQMELSKLGSDGFIFIANNQGAAELSPSRYEAVLLEHQLSQTQLEQLDVVDVVTDVVGRRLNQSRTPIIETQYLGLQGFMKAIKIHDNFILVTWVPNTEILEKTQELATVVIGLTLLTIAITIILLFSSLNYFVLSPIQKLRSAATEIGKGVLNKAFHMKQNDEIGDLAYSFDEMRKNMLVSHEHLEKMVDDRTVEVRKALEEAEKSSQEKSKFLSRMSHELRTPLNAIIGYSHLFGYDANLTEHQKRNVNEINVAGEHLLSLIDEVLDLSKIEAGSLKVNLEPILVEKVISNSCLMTEPLAKAHNISINFDSKLCSELYVLADYTRFKQVLLNLLSNAVKYNQEYGQVELSCSQTTDNFIRISVKDTGRGISEEDMSQLFEPFSRLGAEYSDTEGTGIGLMITTQLVELMQGRMGVESTLDEGSTFWIELGVTDASILNSEIEFQNKIYDDENVITASHKHAHILVAEDNEANQDVLRQQLHVLGYEVDFANDGVEAFEKWKNEDYALLLTDIHMPRMSGFELVRKIRDTKRYAESDMKIIAISADAMDGQIHKCKEAGIDAHIPKPVHMDELKKKLNYWLSLNSKEGIPELEINDTPEKPHTADVQLITSENSHINILVAEDNEANQELLELQLDMLGYKADFANDGIEAYELWESNEYTLLLTDIHMPRLGGYELVKKIRDTKRYAESDMKIIAVSADAKDILKKGAKEAGMDDYISKPVFINVLEEKINKWLPKELSSEDIKMEVPISMPELIKIVGSDPDIIKRLLHKFIQSATETVQDIHDSFSQNNGEALIALAHKLKGGSRSMGAIQLGDKCQILENVIMEQNWKEAESLVKIIDDLFQAIKHYVEEQYS